MGHFSHLTMPDRRRGDLPRHPMGAQRRVSMVAPARDPAGGRRGRAVDADHRPDRRVLGRVVLRPDKVLGLWLFQVMPIEDLLGIAVVSSAAACAVLVFGYGPRRWI